MSCGGRTLIGVGAIIVSILWPLLCVRPATADITATGDINPTYDGTDPWGLPSELIVGQNADAGILVSGGSQVQVALSTIIASGPDVTAGVTVTGAGSTWRTGWYILVGSDGQLNVSTGGRVTSSYAHLESGSAATVTGPGSTWQIGEYLDVWSDGQLNVSAGGRVESRDAYL